MISLKESHVPKDFWMLSMHDFLCFGTMLISTSIAWIGVFLGGSFKDVHRYWDGPNYLYAAITMYDIPDSNPWTLYYQYPPSYFACHLPGYPLLIKICSLLLFNHYILGFYLSIIVSQLLFVYAFRRMLIVFKCVDNPLITTMVACFIPIRFVIYHSVGASEPLYISLICFTFIFFKIRKYFTMILFVWLCCITRIEGMAVGFTIGCCYLLKKQILKALGMFSTFLAPLFVVLFHIYRFNDPLAYIHFNQGMQQLVQWPPFSEAMYQQVNEFYNYSNIATLLIGLLGAFLCFERNIPVGIFAVTHLSYVTLLFHIDVFRYQLPAYVLALFIGYDKFWSSNGVVLILLILSPAYVFVSGTYACGQIHSNIAIPDFMNYMFKSIGLDQYVNKV